MEMPPIHMCAFLSHENERLKRKILDLKRQRAELHRIIATRTSDQTHSCSISCQTDINLGHRPAPRFSPPNPRRLPSDEHLRLHRLLQAQNELLKKYETEATVDRSPKHSSSSSSSERLHHYERRLSECEREKAQAEQRAIATEERLEKVEERYQRMRREIGALDENFFEEIEDLKFALQQANNLNREYERTVQMLSTRLGIAYPKVETRN